MSLRPAFLWATLRPCFDRPLPELADHATDFSRRYADDLDIATGQVMLDLGLANEEIGARDVSRNLEHRVYYPDERDCGGVNQIGQITVDFGVINPEAMDAPNGEECGKLWRKTRLQPRLEAIIAHEKAEHENGHDHELALIAAPDTQLPISHGARRLLRAQETGLQGYPE